MKKLDYEALLQNPNIRAFANAVNAAEGSPTYGNTFGYGNFNDFTDHPRQYSDYKGNKTSAAGSYQIVASTYDSLRKKYEGLNDFSPASQDKAFVALLADTGALQPLLQGDFDGGLKRASRVWASLPYSNAGQPKKAYSFVKKIFDNAYAQNTDPTTYGDTLLGSYTTTPNKNVSSNTVSTAPNLNPLQNYTPTSTALDNNLSALDNFTIDTSSGIPDNITRLAQNTPADNNVFRSIQNSQQPNTVNSNNDFSRFVSTPDSFIAPPSDSEYSMLSEGDSNFDEDIFQRNMLNTTINAGREDAIDRFTGRDPVNLTSLPSSIANYISGTIRNQLKDTL